MLRQSLLGALGGCLVASLAGAQDVGVAPSMADSALKLLRKPDVVAAPTNVDSYTVVYAGRLLGYYRVPEVQVMNSRQDRDKKWSANCAGDVTPESTPEAFKFGEILKLADQRQAGTTLRVAVGDNFGPFLLARQMWDWDDDPNQKGPHLVEKQFYVGLDRAWISELDLQNQRPLDYKNLLDGNGEIPMDNVACFFRRMEFDAIVPGKHDFYFGPSRLRYLARFLRLADKGSGYETLHPTRMLGVNLYLQTREVTASTAPGAAAPENDPQAPPPLKADALQKPPAECAPTSPKEETASNASEAAECENSAPRSPKITTPKAVLPWMRSVQIEDWIPGAQACVVDVAKLAIRLGKRLESLTPSEEQDICKRPEFPLDDPETSDHTASIEGTRVLDYDTMYAVAVVRKKPVNQRYLAAWQLFSVAPPFFGYSGSTKTVAPADKPWFIKPAEVPGGKAVAVFGVVDPNLMQFVGRFNYVWLEERKKDFHVDDHYETDLQVGDPAEALKQALEYCRLVEECKNARKVLLAQMPQQTAYDMLSSFRSLKPRAEQFDLVIAEADPDRGSGNRTVVREPDTGANAGNPEFPDPVVLVPDPGAFVNSDHPDQMHVRVQRAIVTPGDASKAQARVIRNVSLPQSDEVVTTEWIPKESPLEALKGGKSLLQHLQERAAAKDTKLQKLSPDAKKDEWTAGLHELALKEMARVCHSDVAMLQKRDVFWVPNWAKPEFKLNENGFEAFLDAIFWKGDYVECMNVTGATINALLQRSKELQQKQHYGLLSDVALTKDWSLVTLGANEEQSDDTHRLIGGRLVDPKKLYSIAVTDFLAGGDTGYPALQGAEPPPETSWNKTKIHDLVAAITGKREPESAAENLDSLTRLGLLPKPPHTPDRTFSDWFKSAFAGVKTAPSSSQLQKSAQEGPTWSIDLYKADFSYSMAAHSGLERDIPNLFPGVSAVDLTTQNTSAITFDYLLRVQRDAGGNEVYLQSEMNYGYKKTRQAAKNPIPGSGDPYSRNQPADFVYNEIGYARHIHPAHESPDGLKLLFPVGLQTQLTPSITLPEGLSVASGNPALVVSSPKSFYLEGRPGIRWDYSFPKPGNWNMGQGGGGQSSGSSQPSGSGGKGGKGGKGGGSAGSSSQNSGGQNGGSGSGSGSGQNQTFDSYLEFGYQFGPSLHGPKDYVFNDPTGWMTAASNPANTPGTLCMPQTVSGARAVVSVANVVNCFAAAATSIPAALTNFSAPTLAAIDGGRTHFQNGLYLNYRIDMPVPLRWNDFNIFSNMEIVSELRSDFFFGHGQDSPVDTHFLVDSKQSLNIPIFPLFSGKLSLAPSVEMIFYTNKISNNIYKSYTTSVSLNYSFDKRKGLSFMKALGYQNPVPALPSLPSR